MANVDYRGDGAAQLTAVSAGKCYRLQKRIDTATSNLGSGDIVALFNIPANTYIQSVHIEVETAEGGTATVDVGLHSDLASTPTEYASGSADGFLDGVSVNSTAGTILSSTTPTLTEGTPNTYSPEFFVGKAVTTAALLTMTVNNALDAAVFTVQAICFDLTAPINSATTVYNY